MRHFVRSADLKNGRSEADLTSEAINYYPNVSENAPSNTPQPPYFHVH